MLFGSKHIITLKIYYLKQEVSISLNAFAAFIPSLNEQGMMESCLIERCKSTYIYFHFIYCKFLFYLFSIFRPFNFQRI